MGLLVALVRFGPTANLLASTAVGTPFFLLASFAGVMLWRDRPSGYFASVAVQLPQLIKIAAPQFAFMLGLGGDLALVRIIHHDQAGKLFSVVKFNAQGGSYSVIEINRPVGAPKAFGVSIIPCIALVLLRKGWRSADERDRSTDGSMANTGRLDGQPDWVLPFWFKLALVLFALMVSCCCTGSLLLPGGR